MKKVLLVAGNFNLTKNEDETYGKQSHLIHKMYLLLKNEKDLQIDYYNGGNYNNLKLWITCV